MTQFGLQDSGHEREARLPRRDWILLPLLALLTIGLLAASTELAARLIFSESKAQEVNCLILGDSHTAVRGIPGCVVWDKDRESQPVRYRFNRSGHRADQDFGPKAPGSYRIVMVGPSTAMGFRVRLEDSFAALLPEQLSRARGAKVEVLNESLSHGGGDPSVVALRINEVLAAKPDMILWVLDPYSIQHASMVESDPGLPTRHGTTKRMLKAALSRNSTWEKLRDLGAAARYGINAALHQLTVLQTQFLLRHLIYQDQSLYVASCLRSDVYFDYLKSDLTPTWNGYLEHSEVSLAEVSARARAAGVTLAVVLVPERAQAAMISMGKWQPGYDPYKLGDAVRAMVTTHGGIYLDILPEFRSIPNPERLYFPVDGHPNAQGHAILAGLLARHLTSGAIPALKAQAQPAAAVAPGG
jgi:hypothetical protein